MLPLPLSRNPRKPLMHLLGAGLLTAGVLVLMIGLTGSFKTEVKRSVRLPTVYLSAPLASSEEAIPPEEVPVKSEPLPSVPSEPLPLTVPFEAPALPNVRFRLPDYAHDQPAPVRLTAVPVMQFESTTPAAPTVTATVSTMTLAKPIHRIPPQYPMKAKQLGIEGFVTMALLINEEGRVNDIRILKETPEGVFRASAQKVVRRWTFAAPPVASWQTLTIRYQLDKS